ncbi:MAG: PD-(D/E)XK nuclease family protein [Roseovarius pacificus]|nr:PD-(D/E)XK nuclease family protein [Roseovarius pacificus]
MNDIFIPTLSHATERDVDLLIVEELHASHNFALWISQQAGIDTPIVARDVKHSKRRTRSRREIDIFLELFHADGERSALLLENKLDAGEQPDQAESYRAELDILADEYRSTAMVIVCPEGYSNHHHEFTNKFDAIVTYEAIHSFLLKQLAEVGNDTVLRLGFRAELIDQAINKHRRGYVAIPDPIVGDFNAKYVDLLGNLAPEIYPGSSMLKPADPRESTSMIFDQEKTLRLVSKDVRPSRFAHELGRGKARRANYVAVTFPGWGAALPIIREQLEADILELGADLTAKKPTKTRPNPSLVLSIPTEPVDNQGDFTEQREALEDGIVVAEKLRRWLISNQDCLARWGRLVEDVKIAAI